MPKELDRDFIDFCYTDDVLSQCSKTFHPISFYGRARDNKLGNTSIKGSISPQYCVPYVFATDGKYFEHDFNARMLYEKKLSKEV